MNYTGLIDHYRDRLPFGPEVRAISLGEGRTPLIQLRNLPSEIGFEGEIYVKFEGLNPTGSFKDRGMTMAVTDAIARGQVEHAKQIATSDLQALLDGSSTWTVE